MKLFFTVLLALGMALTTYAQKADYAGIYKDIMASSAENFKGFVGDKFLENEKGTYYKASVNQVDADTVYFANLKAIGELGYTAVYRNHNLKQIEVLNQMNQFMNDYNNEGLAKVSLSRQANVDYMVMESKKNGKWMAALINDHNKNELTVWVLSGWYKP